jgi:nucleolar protein 12
MLPRVLRVVRAKAVRKTALASASSRPSSKNPRGNSNKERVYNPRVTSEFSSLKGRASKLLGKAGSAQLRKKEGSGANGTVMGKRVDGKSIDGITKTPESIVFEGYRASAKSGKPKDLKMGCGGKKKGKPKGRSASRASEWKKSGGKKMK